MQTDESETHDQGHVSPRPEAEEEGASAGIPAEAVIEDHIGSMKTRTVNDKVVRHLPPSKRNVPCGYTGCKFNGVNLKRHMRRVHPEKPIHIRGSGFEPSGKFNHWIAPSQHPVEVSGWHAIY